MKKFIISGGMISDEFYARTAVFAVECFLEKYFPEKVEILGFFWGLAKCQTASGNIEFIGIELAK